jgi:hypothetical protein
VFPSRSKIDMNYGTKRNCCYSALLEILETIVALPHTKIFACPPANEVRKVDMCMDTL